MKLKTHVKITLVAAGLLTTGAVMAQPSKTTSAYSALDDWMDEEDKLSERAVSALKEAKEFIDESYNFSNDKFNGKQDAKTLYYKGKIYISFGAYEGDEQLSNQFDIPALVQEGVDAYEAHLAIPEKRSKNDKTPEIKRDLFQMRNRAANRGNDFFDKENYGEAMKEFASAAHYLSVAGVFDSLEYYNAGLCAALTENWEKSAEYHKICAQNGYKVATTYARWAEALFNMGKEDEAIAALEEGRTKVPKNPDLYITEGNHWMLKGETEKATAAFQGAIDADPTNHQVYYAVGNMQFSLEDYDNAEDNFKKALEIKSDYVDALYGMGALYNNKAADIDKEIDGLDFKLMEEKSNERDKHLETALGYFEKAHEADPTDKLTLQSLHQIYTKLGQYDKAKEMKDLLDN